MDRRYRTYQYDASGRLIELTYPGGTNRKVTYSYYDTGEINQVTLWQTDKVATYTYDDARRLDHHTNFNGTLTSYVYDEANRLTLLEHKKTGGAVIARYHITELDAVGNRKQMEQTEPPPIDPNRPFIRVPGPDAATYTYEQYNNKQTDRLHSDGTNSYGYDDEGQLHTRNTSAVTYTFDYDHKLKTIQQGQASTDFSYDGLGNRLKYTRETIGPPVTTVTTYYIYDLHGNLLAEADGNKNITKYYIHGNGLMAMVVPDATPANDQVYTYHFNAIGSTVALTNSSQEVVNKYACEPFGEILAQEELIPQPFKYVGQYGVMHEPNGFYYMRARYYDPKVGRFVSEDPIRFEGGTVNLYEYVGNNSVNKSDPEGLKSTDSLFTFFNGNLIPNALVPWDTNPDWVCSFPAGYFNGDECTKQCCIVHDTCYVNHECNATSWYGPPSSCQLCNAEAIYCITICKVKGCK